MEVVGEQEVVFSCPIGYTGNQKGDDKSWKRFLRDCKNFVEVEVEMKLQKRLVLVYLQLQCMRMVKEFQEIVLSLNSQNIIRKAFRKFFLIKNVTFSDCKALDKPLGCRQRETSFILLSFSYHERKRGGRMVQTTIRMPEKLYQQLKKEAKERGVSVNGLMLMVLHEGIQKKNFK